MTPRQHSLRSWRRRHMAEVNVTRMAREQSYRG
jgi:hypothetical protein